MKDQERRTRLPIGIIRVIILLIAVFFFAGAMEGGAIIYNLITRSPTTLYRLRQLKPPPYRDASYFSQEFISESFRQPGGWQYPKGTQLIIPNDFSGKYFNVADGKRRTAFQPDDFEHAVYVFGGSTVYCSEVPDEFTMPSRLQLILGQRYGKKCLVENYGTTTVSVAQQVERLKTVRLAKGDIVVFFDGDNDVYQRVYLAAGNQSELQKKRDAFNKMNFLLKLRFWIYLNFVDRSQFVKTFMNPYNVTIPNHLTNEVQRQHICEELYLAYKANILEANRIASAAGARFFHFLQPNLFTMGKRTKYEEALIRNRYITPVGFEIAVRIAYPVLRKVVSDIAAECRSSDFSTLLSGRTLNEEFYLDAWHVNDRANQIVAESIANIITGAGDQKESGTVTGSSAGR